jgi:alkanesulfonate monooxygenase SsuD/methylene tetrahydromethanopterin reductase-like flavin-dependent oxidoreductase (luciferase family)
VEVNRSPTHPSSLSLIFGKRVPGDNSKNKDSLEYYLWLAKLAEKGKITGIFFADTYGVHDTWPGQTANQFLSGATCAQMDPIVWVSAMASVTKSVSFGITASTSYINVGPL